MFEIHRGQGWDVRSHMSVNAKEAYDNGELPMSKWRSLKKAELFDLVESDLDLDDEKEARLINNFKAMSKEEILGLLLEYAGWHHVGEKHFMREVNFYKIDSEREESLAINDWSND